MRFKSILVRGFTLLELMMVLVLISITLGWAVSSYVESSRRNRFRSDVSLLQLALKEARDLAIREGSSASVCLFEGADLADGSACPALTKMSTLPALPVLSNPYDPFPGTTKRPYVAWQQDPSRGRFRGAIVLMKTGMPSSIVRMFDLSFDEIFFPPAMNDTPESIIFGPDGRLVGVHPWLYDVPPTSNVSTNPRSAMAIHLGLRNVDCRAYLLADRSGLFSLGSNNKVIQQGSSFDVQRGDAQQC
jgi:prepilin-type N-terminal cleavage/methylation domain-containing protein